jgi:hypothetical protein
MPAGGKRPGAGRPKGSRALTLLAPTGERMSFYEAARQYDKKALQVMASILLDETHIDDTTAALLGRGLNYYDVSAVLGAVSIFSLAAFPPLFHFSSNKAYISCPTPKGTDHCV